MPHPYIKHLFTDSVKNVQEEYGVREMGQQLEDSPVAHDVFAERERAFIEARDSFYMATVNSDGWPYVQHRGGPKGFLRVINKKTIAFADFRGNDQYISVGNLRSSNLISIILMDYPNRRRLKILGYCRVVTEREDLMQVAKLEPSGYGYSAHRAMIITLHSFDWNCPQHITQRFTPEEFKAPQPKQHDATHANLAPPTQSEIKELNGTFILVRITGIYEHAEHIYEFILQPLDGHSVAPYAGSHICVAVRGQDNEVKTNAYSLINSPTQRNAWHIAVRKEPDGDGGSCFMHDTLHIGDHLYVQPPKNDFPLIEKATHSILIAGGIGITAILSMAKALHACGSSFEIHYTTRTRKSMAFKQQISNLANNNTYFYYSREKPLIKPDLNRILSKPHNGKHLYVCGPKRLIEATLTTAKAKNWTKEQIHFELFNNPSIQQNSDKPIEMILHKSDKTIHVAKHQSVLDALLNANITVDFSCKRGECTKCKVPVLEGEIDHRDIILDSDEKKVGNVMCSCVSRVKGNRLVLDL